MKNYISAFLIATFLLVSACISNLKTYDEKFVEITQEYSEVLASATQIITTEDVTLADLAIMKQAKDIADEDLSNFYVNMYRDADLADVYYKRLQVDIDRLKTIVNKYKTGPPQVAPTNPTKGSRDNESFRPSS